MNNKLKSLAANNKASAIFMLHNEWTINYGKLTAARTCVLTYSLTRQNNNFTEKYFVNKH